MYLVYLETRKLNIGAGGPYNVRWVNAQNTRDVRNADTMMAGLRPLRTATIDARTQSREVSGALSNGSRE
jgi:hypothetical protein